jgi:hypothetical protein
MTSLDFRDKFRAAIEKYLDRLAARLDKVYRDRGIPPRPDTTDPVKARCGAMGGRAFWKNRRKQE